MPVKIDEIMKKRRLEVCSIEKLKQFQFERRELAAMPTDASNFRKIVFLSLPDSIILSSVLLNSSVMLTRPFMFEQPYTGEALYYTLFTPLPYC
jgi:hypothetical protein